MRKHCLAILMLGLTAFLFISPISSFAADTSEFPAGFDPNYILSDSDIFNVNDFTFDSIVNFLKSKGALADYRTADIDGIPKTAAEIIWRVANSYKINPKYLIALLQKEQSLVDDPAPKQNQFDWATGYAICDSCAKDDPALQEFKGFASQLEWAAKQHREKYFLQLLTRGLTIGGKGIGTPTTIDGRVVTPVNHATAMLYSYTPHIHGNLNLWRIWKRWFAISYPDGTVVRTNSNKQIYLMRFGEKRPFSSPAVAASLIDETKIIDVQETDIANYPEGRPLKFPKYSLLKDPDGKIFLLTQDAKRQIVNMETFRKFGFNSDEIIDATHDDLAGYESGPKITMDTSFPQGILMKTANSKGVWYVEDGKRSPLVDGVFIKLYFRGRQIRTVTEKTLGSYEINQPYALHNGELVRSASSSTVYVIEEGRLRPIPSEEIFEKVGWQWKNVISVPDKVLAQHPLGEPFLPQPATEIKLVSSS